MSNNEQAPAAEQPELTVGQLLKQERERRKLTLEHVAKQLNLKADVLHCLEADQPDKTILPTFMRGYLRAYARFLKIPEQQLLSRFEQTHQVKSAPVKAMKTFSNRQAKQQTETRFMWLTYVILAILLASFAVWLWQGARDFNTTTSSAETTLSNPIATEASALPQTSTVLSVEQASDSARLINPEVVEAEPDLTATEQPVLVEEAEQLAEVAAVAENPTESFGDSSNSGLDRLKMTFSDNCWIDVLDGDGERIAYGTKQSGYVMELNAKGPFTITLGNPSVVAIDINQKPFDMSGFPGGRVAKFTLAGQDE
ncbi:transcriptional regulator [Alishewanella longhuensis]|uniref:Transcriptional regulator n=1 Tax=Alishewanella longhuensis TaxID=1091037 RepID=A0ABQ3KX53_9ALTE|nr:RodZ domain-containing protein [Alishewanella longhuensis]GHG62310.1 transcriptional regulator [Alishewanella longhuensis]